MKFNDLPPGWYKVKQQQYNAYGAKHPRRNDNPPELLLVTGQGESKKYFFGGSLVGRHPAEVAFIDAYEVVSRYDGEGPVIENCTITLSFRDRSGDGFSFTVRDVWALRNLFDAIRWLRSPFGYVPRKGK